MTIAPAGTRSPLGIWHWDFVHYCLEIRHLARVGNESPSTVSTPATCVFGSPRSTVCPPGSNCRVVPLPLPPLSPHFNSPGRRRSFAPCPLPRGGAGRRRPERPLPQRSLAVRVSA